MRLIGAVFRSVVVHRLLTALVPNRLIRLLVEGLLLLPAVMDSRLVRWLRAQVTVLRARTDNRATQGEQTACLGDKARPTRQQVEVTTDPAIVETVEPVTEPAVLEGDVLPSNRAERRAKHRQDRRRTA